MKFENNAFAKEFVKVWFWKIEMFGFTKEFCENVSNLCIHW